LNLLVLSNVSITNRCREPGEPVSLLKRLFGKGEASKPRVRVCVECGMPIEEHRDWCSILRGQHEMSRKAAGATDAP